MMSFKPYIKIKNSFCALLIKVKLALNLGLCNIGRIILYKTKLKIKRSGRQPKHLQMENGIFFSTINVKKSWSVLNTHWQNDHIYFSYLRKQEVSPPNWHSNILNGVELDSQHTPWYDISDFEQRQGDIKGVWEASRFDWAIALAQQAAIGNDDSLNKLNLWLNDWVSKNPTEMGANWKCGQEASIRLMHFAMAALILDQTNNCSVSSYKFIYVHLQRISSTLLYGLAQDNNHGTSEAAALYIGGSWLAQQGCKTGRKWQALGEKWLVNRANRLIADDGSFSQYSVTYHRVMLDSYCMVEAWRRHLKLSDLHASLYTKLKLSTLWLYSMTQSSTGAAPNLGSNDGARLLPLTNANYRDFRPCIQLACALFLHKRAYDKNVQWDAPLNWLNIAIPKQQLTPPTSKDFSDGGYCVLIHSDAFALINYPRYRFRPHQNDALHIDFWLGGENLLRDAGTFSYNHSDEKTRYFNGVESHNTIEFDQHEQMPRISRFLLSHWLQTTRKSFNFSESLKNFSTTYSDYLGCTHERSLALTDSHLKITDTVSGFKNSAILRWRLKPGQWKLAGNKISNGVHCIAIQSNVKINRIEITSGIESIYYFQESSLPVIEIEINEPGTITTEYNYKQ